jgi:hypothetical protein
MTAPTETARRQMLAEINASPAVVSTWNTGTDKSGTQRTYPRTSRCWASWHRSLLLDAAAISLLLFVFDGFPHRLVESRFQIEHVVLS